MIKRDAVNKLSCAAVSRRLPMFEAGFLAGCAYARADVLVPVGREQWDIVEVKSTTKTKAEHVNDLALQRHVYEGVGLGIRRCFVMHLNSAYVRRGEIDPSELFTKTDVTADVDDVVGDVGSELKKMVRIIGQQRSPDADIGLQCSDPYDCPLQPMCWKAVPKHSVLTLAHVAKKKAFQWFHDGHARLQDLPRDTPVNAKQQIQLRAIRSRRAQVDRDALREFLDGLEYPLHFLDFETINPAIPVWNITSPYQQVPFQFSLHIVSSPGGKPAHHGFFGRGHRRPAARDPRAPQTPPRPARLDHRVQRQLRKERAAGLRRSLPSFRLMVGQGRVPRCRPLAAVPEFHYYHPDQCGSASLKAVLPALTGKGYADMKIADGATASQGFLRITFGEASAAEHRKVRAALEKYCALDTEGMVWIVKALDRLR